jgi:chemotaxis-related protein WspB
MLFLVLQLGRDLYAIEASQIVEILPLVAIRGLPRAPKGLAGLFDYHGEPTPVVDLAELATGIVSRHRMSTRIIVVKDSRPSGVSRLLGLLVEQAMTTLRRSEAEFVDAGISVAATPYFGSITNHEGSIVQRINIQNLLTGSVRNLLFGEQLGLE